MILVAIDVGNTNIVVGCMDGVKSGEILFTARLSTDRLKTEDEYAMMLMNLFAIHQINQKEIEGGIISSVVPDLKRTMQKALEKITGRCPLVVGSGVKTGLNIKIDNPAQLGSDLVVDAVAACAQYPRPILIFDMGTATTLSVIDRDGNYLGGMIMPGLRKSVDALVSGTSQLPRIGLDEPEQVIGTNTINCMKAGAIYGNAAMLDGLIDRVEEALGEPAATVLATGGLVSCVAPYCRRNVICDENLMLRGLWLIYQKNMPKGERK